ncbi:hypothetical protein [Candidatus Entotheonella palauensis]|uniref:Uncharacterized protein n=1 Tax=Candidatus Entotheonella gemina TaxID=1429439 RepID=W4MCJ8_9BACT|nr:hypothetical protein [Candidatus Entotheonella palauensis]ETX07337.1 MAG: hypothetical protein ETSY2_11810 [Candidatus Entotheonella gemina]
MPKAMSITTIRKTFPDEWVMAQVTDVDDDDVPTAGVVLTHTPDEDTIFDAVKLHLTKYPNARLYTFFTGDIVPEGVNLAFPFG